MRAFDELVHTVFDLLLHSIVMEKDDQLVFFHVPAPMRSRAVADHQLFCTIQNQLNQLGWVEFSTSPRGGRLKDKLILDVFMPRPFRRRLHDAKKNKRPNNRAGNTCDDLQVFLTPR